MSWYIVDKEYSPNTNWTLGMQNINHLVFDHAKMVAWPKNKNSNKLREAIKCSLSVSLNCEWKTDAHFPAYWSGVPYRLDYGAIRDQQALDQLGGAVLMQLAVFDVDAASSHRAQGGDPSKPAGDDWWLKECEKISTLIRFIDVYKDLFIYRTRGGYRIIGLLPERYELRNEGNCKSWSYQYVLWCAYLKLNYGIICDLGMKDWTRLYRLPRATRDKTRGPERRETIGDCREIGVWNPTLTSSVMQEADKLWKKPNEKKIIPVVADTYIGNGILYDILSRKGLLGPEIDRGKWAIKCPLQNEHSKSKWNNEFDGSTVLYSPSAGEQYGFIYCKHSGSGHDRFTLADWLKVLI